MNRNTFSSDIYVQSSGPCIVCDIPSDGLDHPSGEYVTVHPSCLSKVSSSADNHSTSSNTTNLLPDGAQLWQCSKCGQLLFPTNFPVDNHTALTCYNCIDEECGKPDWSQDFRSFGEDMSKRMSNISLNETVNWTCAMCQQPKHSLEFSLAEGSSEATTICDECINPIISGQPYDPNSPLSFDTPILVNQSYCYYDESPDLVTSSINSSNIPSDPQSSHLLNQQPYHQSLEPREATNLPPRQTKRIQTRRPSKPTHQNQANDPDPNPEPVIQWISRRNPLPPNVCSRCRCRYARPGKKQCQHCAHDYRGTRDHRASLGLCITCAAPLDRERDYINTYHTSTSTLEDGTAAAAVGEGAVVMGRPRRSCEACREKMRLRKAGDKERGKGVGVKV